MAEKKSHELDSYTHNQAERTNNPAAGLAQFDKQPDTPHTYSFDPHESPALQWAGKSESETFDVMTTSIHVHEIVKPLKIVNPFLKKTQQKFFDFAMSDEAIIQEKVRALDAYNHSENWKNRMIAGDSLVIMNSLLQKESMAGQVQTVYFDPPYGIKYGSNFQPFVGKRDVKDKSDDDLTSEPEMIKAFRDTWELGVHSYLSYLRNRLLLVKDLLSESGSVFVQISDENVHHVREICDEIFGAKNFVTMIKFKKTGSMSLASLIGSTTDYLVWYAKDKESVKYHQLYVERRAGEASLDMYNYVELEDGSVRRLTSDEIKNKNLLSSRRIFRYTTLLSGSQVESSKQIINFKGEKFVPPAGKNWKTSLEGMNRLIEVGRVDKSGNGLRYKRYLGDFPLMELGDIWSDTGGATDMRYVVQTSTKVIQRCILMTSDPGDLVLDITCGSGTTAYVAEQWARRWITCDTSRVAIAIARQRLLTASFDFYKPADPQKGISAGFQYKTVPHITLKSIANNEPPQSEILYDAPEIDRSKIRLAGPFSVEALPAPVVFSVEEAAQFVDDPNASAKLSDWREQLLATGIIGRNGERIRFSSIEARQGTKFINAEAFTDEKNPRRAMICFANESTLMDSKRVSGAFDEALTLKPEILIFAAFQFDPVASQMINDLMRMQEITALQAQMNPDLMTDDLKKKLRLDQSFWLVGQPDVEVEKLPDGKFIARVLGFDYYNVGKNKVESGNADKIAMWLLDTDYNGMNINPSQVFFPMEGKAGGWGRLAKTLRAEIDSEALEKYSGNESLPFEAGKKIAVKIIDDRGIESMKVIEVSE